MTTKTFGSEGFKWFLGIVVDIADPLKLGRVRVRIFNEHTSDISTNEISWATLMVSPTSASLAGIGISPTGIEVGSFAFGFYMDGNEKQYPVVIGTYHKIPQLKEENHDVSLQALGKNAVDKNYLDYEPQSQYAAEYPNNKTYTTKSGHVIEIDDTQSAERIHIYHSSGTYVEINPDGTMVTKSVQDNIEITVNNKEITVDQQDLRLETKNGNISITSKGNINIQAEKDLYVNVKGDITHQCDGDFTVNAVGNIKMVKGSL